jgi:hypothetical protein
MRPVQFSFPAQRQLRKRLGEVGALVELNELAVRAFSAAASASGNVMSFVQQACDAHDIRVRAVTLDGLSVHAAQSYVLMVHQELEVFVRDLQGEHEALVGSSWVKRDEKEGLLAWVVRAANAHCHDRAMRVDLALPDYRVVLYYSALRTALVHPHLRDEHRLDRRLKKVSESLDDIVAAYGVQPAAFDSLSFDDFVLFSRATRDLGDELGRACAPSDDELLAAATRAIEDVRRRATRAKRIEKAATSKLMTEYGLDSDRAARIITEAHGLGGGASPSMSASPKG